MNKIKNLKRRNNYTRNKRQTRLPCIILMTMVNEFHRKNIIQNYDKITKHLNYISNIIIVTNIK